MRENLLVGNFFIAFQYKIEHRSGIATNPNLYVWNSIEFLLQSIMHTELRDMSFEVFNIIS